MWAFRDARNLRLPVFCLQPIGFGDVVQNLAITTRPFRFQDGYHLGYARPVLSLRLQNRSRNCVVSFAVCGLNGGIARAEIIIKFPEESNVVEMP